MPEKLTGAMRLVITMNKKRPPTWNGGSSNTSLRNLPNDAHHRLSVFHVKDGALWNGLLVTTRI
jgi:hypothetical protein